MQITPRKFCTIHVINSRRIFVWLILFIGNHPEQPLKKIGKIYIDIEENPKKSQNSNEVKNGCTNSTVRIDFMDKILKFRTLCVRRGVSRNRRARVPAYFAETSVRSVRFLGGYLQEKDQYVEYLSK